MIKRLLVDDDYLVRMYLLAVADWKKEGFEIVADVQDGEQALEKIEELKPELVITDISMPVMDGIELIKEIRNRQIPCRIIVLSCHDSYPHVKEALKQGADDYILKNELKNENICNILDNLRNKIIEAREEAKQKKILSQLVDLGSNELRKKFLNIMTENDYDYDYDYDYNQLQEKSHTYGIYLSLLKTAVIVIKILKPFHNLEFFNEKNQEIFSRLIKICQEILGDTNQYEIIAKTEYEYILILDGVLIPETSIFHSIVSKLYMTINQIIQLSSVIVVSDVCIGKDSLKHAYLHATQALDSSFYKKDNIYHYELKNTPVLEKTSFNRFYDDVKKLLITSNIDGIMEQSRNQILRFEKEFTKPEIVIDWVREMDNILRVERKNDVYEQILHIEQVRELIDSYGDHIHYYPNISTKITNITVAQTIEYITQNYKKAISLVSVAETLKVNSTYLSRIFKQETKMNFTDYLNFCRIENAKSLLSSTNKKIKDVSIDCGFYDYRYFCKMFKKTVGQNPLSYRRNLDPLE